MKHASPERGHIQGQGVMCQDDPAREAVWEGRNETRSCSEDWVCVGGIDLFSVSLSGDHVRSASSFFVHDVQHLCHARHILAHCNPQPVGKSQSDRLYSMVKLRSCRRYGHASTAKHGFSWRIGWCGAADRYRSNLDCARACTAACCTRARIVAMDGWRMREEDPQVGRPPTRRVWDKGPSRKPSLRSGRGSASASFAGPVPVPSSW
jgi:hypothetical protein